MHIRRTNTRLYFRRRQRGTCLSWTLLFGLLIGVFASSWAWLGQRLFSPAALNPNGAERLESALASFQHGDLDASIDLARQALADQPDSFDALALLVRALIFRSYSEYDRAIDRTSALELAQEGFDDHVKDARYQALYAYALQADGQAATAADIALLALRQNPNDTLARTALALAYGGVGSLEAALRESSKAVSLAPNDIDALRALAISHSDLGDYQQAIGTIKQAIQQHNRLIPLYFERALYAMQIGDADSATAAYFQALTIAPNNIKARMRLCELSSLLREHDSALAYCGEVAQRAPTWSQGWYQLGMEHFLTGDFRAAQTAFHRCSTLQVMQNVPISQRKLACWYLQGQSAELVGDCPALLATYHEFQAMAALGGLQQTWAYPPEGPSICASSTTPTPLSQP